MSFIEEAAVFLGAAIIAVTLFNKLGFGSVLGYSLAGAAIGPWGLGIITDAAEEWQGLFETDMVSQHERPRREVELADK